LVILDPALVNDPYISVIIGAVVAGVAALVAVLIASHFTILRKREHPNELFEPIIHAKYLTFIFSISSFFFGVALGLLLMLFGQSSFLYSLFLGSCLFAWTQFINFLFQAFPIYLRGTSSAPAADPNTHLNDVAKDILYEHMTKKPDA
jgi:hypothetical protein